MSVAVPVVVGFLTFAAILVILTTQRRALVRDRMTPYLGSTSAGGVGSWSRPGRKQWSLAGAVESILERYRLREPIADSLDRAGYELTVGAFALAWVGSAVAVFLLLLMASGLMLGLVGGALAFAFPMVALSIVSARRARAFEAQLPEILDTLAASLKAGHGFDHAMHTVSIDVADPAGREFRRIVAESQLGRPLEDGLSALAKRVRSEDFNFVLDAIQIQRQVGGSLAGLFDLVAQTVRAREEFRRKLRALTGMVRTSANVLTALPIGVGALITLLNPHYMSVLWTTSTGHIMVLVAGLMIFTGAFLLRKIGSVRQ